MFAILILIFVIDFSLAKTLTLANIQITFSSNDTHTLFNLKSTQGGQVSNSWLSVGLNNSPKMVS
jgi:hypothetical protein